MLGKLDRIIILASLLALAACGTVSVSGEAGGGGDNSHGIIHFGLPL